MTARGGTLGIVGTLVHDRIVSADGRVTEAWGGIAYAVASAAATLPADWDVRLIAKVGDDLFEEAESLLDGMPRTTTSLLRVPEANNRVELRYRDAEQRTERLSGGVPGWQAYELAERLDGVEALLVNFIAGWELDPDAAAAARRAVAGPAYADMHSLFLGVAADGTRTPRPLDDWRSWVACFDAVQMNEAELSLLRASPDGPTGLEQILGAGPRLAAVTCGPRGSRVAWDPDHRWRAGDHAPGTRTEVEDVTLVAPRDGDPTGCGDVWGAAMFAGLLGGASVPEAADRANRVACASIDHTGAEGLVDRLADVPRSSGAATYFESPDDFASPDEVDH